MAKNKEKETIFKNTVGRPTNEIKKKRRGLVLGISLAVVLLIGTMSFLVTNNHSNVSKLKGASTILDEIKFESEAYSSSVSKIVYGGNTSTDYFIKKAGNYTIYYWFINYNNKTLYYKYSKNKKDSSCFSIKANQTRGTSQSFTVGEDNIDNLIIFRFYQNSKDCTNNKNSVGYYDSYVGYSPNHLTIGSYVRSEKNDNNYSLVSRSHYADDNKSKTQYVGDASEAGHHTSIVMSNENIKSNWRASFIVYNDTRTVKYYKLFNGTTRTESSCKLINIKDNEEAGFSIPKKVGKYTYDIRLYKSSSDCASDKTMLGDDVRESSKSIMRRNITVTVYDSNEKITTPSKPMLYCVANIGDSKEKSLEEFKVGQEFYCYTNNVAGISLLAAHIDLAEGYDYYYTSTKDNNWIKLKYVRPITFDVVASIHERGYVKTENRISIRVTK